MDLGEISRGLTEWVERASASVVRVEGRRRTGSTGVVWAEGVIVAANHAVERDEDLVVGLPGGEAVEAVLAGRDPATDLCALRVEARDLTPIAWGDVALARVGQLALALARPGRTVRASLGIMSVVGTEEWRAPSGARMDRYLAADVKLAPGFSGGPLLGVDGKALGVCTSAILRGVAFAVPAPTVRRVVESILAHGGVRQGYLGVATQPVSLPEGVGQEAGLLVVHVREGSPAAQAGLLMGDAILAVEGEPVESPGDLLGFLDETRIGAELRVRILRAGVLGEARVTVGVRQG